MLNVAWLVSPRSISKENGKLTSELASCRYRVISPAQYISQKHRVTIIERFPAERDSLRKFAENIDILVVGKSFDYSQIDALAYLREAGLRVIVDVCDIYSFFDESMRKHYASLFRIADLITANSKKMAEYLSSLTAKTINVIDDPFDRKLDLPRFAPNRSLLRLLWFGYGRNIDSLTDSIPNIIETIGGTGFSLAVVTSVTPASKRNLEKLFFEFNDKISLKFIQWSVENMNDALSFSDVVLIPNKMRDDGLVKSANRVIESIAAGRFVVANPIPAYEEFAPYIYLGQNLGDGIRYAVENREQIVRKIYNGQRYISTNYHCSVVGEKWLQLFERFATAEA